jgi:hypothetical protein
LLAVAAPVFAQQSVAEAAAQAKSKREVFPADAPTHDQVMTLLDLLQVRRNMVLMIDGMKNAMKEGAERGFRERVSNPTPKQVDALRGMIDGALSEMPLDEMVEATVAVYRRHLTKSDVEEMIRFYAGPVGQKVLQELPKMLQESMQAGTEIQKKRMDQIIAKIRESEQKMLEADEESNITPKK